MIELISATRKALSSPSSILKRNVLPNLTVSHLIVIVVMMLTLGLLVFNIKTIGDANTYYTAAVKSMLQSWNNFFFIAAEPGGAVSVDKPPLGLWVEAVFGFIFGVSGLSLAIPNVIAGVLDIPLIYILVKKYMGELAGIIAALVLALTPIFVATHRHNTLDGMLVFTLLLATWTFINATETGKLRWLLAGGILIGIGFNIKMMQALLPMPALYTLYALGSREGWLKKGLNLLLTTALFVGVSLAWVITVDRTPESQRPFVGSTLTNRVFELIFDYNAAKRIFDIEAPQAGDLQTAQEDGPNLPPLPRFNGSGISYVQQTGVAGVFRFFTPPLSRQMSWLLPFALFSLLLAVFGSRIKFPVESPIHKSLILWGGWMLTCLVFFSIISGIFHPYYIMIGVPPFCAMIAVGFTLLWNWGQERKWFGIILSLTAAITIGFQWITIQQFQDRSYLIILAGILLVAGNLMMLTRRRSAYIIILAAMLFVPAYWSMMTSISNANRTFPTAYQGGTQRIASSFVENDPNLSANQRLLAYLQTNTRDVKYLVAVPSALQGMPLVLTSERPVYYMGGFSGLDHAIDAQGLKELVAKGDLRYILYAEFFRRPGGTGRGDPEILAWLENSCLLVPDFDRVIVYTRRPNQPDNLDDIDLTESVVLPGPRNDFLTLYLCP
jgi:4-amino-4-deoxy-L-arabinose transferase-like glycosyltransferase